MNIHDTTPDFLLPAILLFLVMSTLLHSGEFDLHPIVLDKSYTAYLTELERIETLTGLDFFNYTEQDNIKQFTGDEIDW